MPIILTLLPAPLTPHLLPPMNTPLEITAASAAVAGDGLKSGLLPHQLRELVVMAGLDPAATSTRQLVEQLLQHRGPAEQQSRIGFDDFMKVIIYFQVSPSIVECAGCQEGGRARTELSSLPH